MAVTSPSHHKLCAETEGDSIHSEYLTSGRTHRFFLGLARPCTSVLASRNCPYLKAERRHHFPPGLINTCHREGLNVNDFSKAFLSQNFVPDLC